MHFDNENNLDPNEASSGEAPGPISERSVAGVASGVIPGLPHPTRWAKNAPEALIGTVILTAGLTLLWLTFAPASEPSSSSAGAPHAPPATAKAKANAKRIAPRVAPSRASVEQEAPAEVSVPWVGQAPAAWASCGPITPRNVTRSIHRRAQAEKRGHDMLLLGDLGAAREAFCVATRHDAPTPLALTGLIRSQLELGDAQSALESATRLVELEPESPEAHNLMGDVLIRLGRVEDAKASWTRAIGAPRLSTWLKARLRSVSMDQAREAIAASAHARAERMLRRAIALDPRDVDAVTQLVDVLSAAKKANAAEQWLEYAERLNPGHPEVKRLRRDVGSPR